MTQNQTKDSCESKNNHLSKHVFILNKNTDPETGTTANE